MQKALQKQLYTFINSRWGIVFVILGLFTFFNGLLSFASVYDPFSDNLVDTSYQQRIIPLPIDIVYTWVNGSDPDHIKALRLAKQTYLNFNESSGDDDTTKLSRFIDNEELRFSLRSVEAQAPWVRHIYIVTNGQVPSWLNVDHPRITMVTHEQIFDAAHLPTFSSPAIEANLHNIDDVSEWFLYLNDDTMFGAPVWPSDFITSAEGQKVFLSWAVPPCNEGCPANWIGDGYCDISCNTTECEWDAGDCANTTALSQGGGAAGGNFWGGESMRYCARGCPNSWIGDKYCDRACKVLDCGFDGGDCGFEVIQEGMLGFQLLPEHRGRAFVVPWNSPSVYFNLSSISGDQLLVDGSHSESESVRIATVSQKFKVMILTFNKNITDTITVDVTWQQGKNFSFLVQPSERLLNESAVITEVEPAGATAEPGGSQGTTGAPGRHLMSEEEEQQWQGQHRHSADKTRVHPMGLGERLGTRVYPWQRSSPSSGRRLLDIYGDSLKHVNALFNARFGNDARKVPAHMPHFLQKSVLHRLHAAFPEEFARTSAHRFRAADDMQFAFSYFYYLINERAGRHERFADLFRERVDTDGDGQASRLELHRQWVLLHEPPVDEQQFLEFLAALRGPRGEPVTPESFDRVPQEKEALLEHYAQQPRQRHEVRDTDSVAFIMVSNNDTKLEARLDGILRRGQKFICLNDNLDHENPETPRIKKLMRDFYTTLYPNPSAFERAEGDSSCAANSRPHMRYSLWAIVALVFLLIVVLYLRRALRSSKNHGRARLEARNKRF